MFGRRKYTYRRKGLGILGIFRVILSLVMMTILGLGFYSAYKHFSNSDSLKLTPEGFADTLSIGNLTNLVSQIFSFNPNKLELNLSSSQPSPTPLASPVAASPKPSLDFKFAIVADSHNDNQDLRKALFEAKDLGAKFVVGAGDYTDVGTVDELRDAKREFDTVGLSYYVIPGDHDLWDSRNRGLDPVTDFKNVFGINYSSFEFNSSKFILVDNSDNYHGLTKEEQQWLDEQLKGLSDDKPKLTFVFLSTPLYHPSSDHVMGKVEAKLKDQAEHLTTVFKRANVAEVFAGDTHFFFRYIEPKNKLKMTAVGAVSRDRNLEGPRFTLVEVFSDGSYNVADMEVK